MKKIIFLVALSFVAFSCSNDTIGEDGDSNTGNGPQEPELLYYASAKVEGKSLNIEYYLDDKPGDLYNPNPGHRTNGGKMNPDFTSYRGGLVPTNLNTTKPMIEVYFQDFVKEAGIGNYQDDFTQLEKIFYKGELPIAEKDYEYGIRVVYGINGVTYSSHNIRQDVEGSSFKVTNVEIVKNRKGKKSINDEGRKTIEVTGEFSCKVRSAVVGSEETLEITNAKFKFLYSSFGKEEKK